MRPPPLHSGYGPQLGILTCSGPFSLLLMDRFNTSTLDSTRFALTGRSAPPSRLVRLKAMGPHQKLGRLESGSLPDLAQSSQRLSHLGVFLTIRNSEVSLPLHSERIRKAVAELGPGLSPNVLSGTPIPQTLFLSISCMISQPFIHTSNSKESRSEKVKAVLLE